jgi:hypothetical protein
MRHLPRLILGCLVLTACEIDEDERLNDDKFPLVPHYLLPQFGPSNGQIAAGEVTGNEAALEQPIGFSHYIHATQLSMDCQYCHSEARKSIYAGVPPVQTCMNCHSKVKTELAEVKKIHHFYCGKEKCGPDDVGQTGTPIEWNKVHDLPDYVHFAHNRHVQAGVNCTECHGQVQLQGRKEPVTVKDENGRLVDEMQVKNVMVRETTLQMGWCLDCHGSHPSIDENYGDNADLRRAELKDCWTCHK